MHPLVLFIILLPVAVHFLAQQTEPVLLKFPFRRLPQHLSFILHELFLPNACHKIIHHVLLVTCSSSSWEESSGWAVPIFFLLSIYDIFHRSDVRKSYHFISIKGRRVIFLWILSDILFLFVLWQLALVHGDEVGFELTYWYLIYNALFIIQVYLLNLFWHFKYIIAA